MRYQQRTREDKGRQLLLQQQTLPGLPQYLMDNTELCRAGL